VQKKIILIAEKYGVSRLEVYKIHAYVLVPKIFMKFMFSTVYRVTQKDFYTRPYTSMWAPVVARQISKHFWMRIFLDVGSEEEVLLPGPLDLRI